MKFRWLALALISMQCHAESVPINRYDIRACALMPWHNLGGCFQNLSGADINKQTLFLRQTIFYTDKRTQIVGTFDTGKLHINRHVIISTSDGVIKNNRIHHVDNELVMNGITLNGCKFTITQNSANVNIAVVNSDHELVCIHI